MIFWSIAGVLTTRQSCSPKRTEIVLGTKIILLWNYISKGVSQNHIFSFFLKIEIPPYPPVGYNTSHDIKALTFVQSATWNSASICFSFPRPRLSLYLVSHCSTDVAAMSEMCKNIFKKQAWAMGATRKFS